MPYDPRRHHRQSIRLKGYDYAQAGLYFITICCKDMASLFGAVSDGKMILNDSGLMIETWYWELENKYPNIVCHEMVVMPNHFHCIIEIMQDSPVSKHDAHGQIYDAHGQIQGAHVGAPLRGRPGYAINNGIEINDGDTKNQGDETNEITRETEPQTDSNQPPIYGSENQKINVPIGQIVDWFKTMTTNEYIRGVKNLGWLRFNGKLWQRNYYEHIIRNEKSLCRITKYIENNPANWKGDKFYPK